MTLLSQRDQLLHIFISGGLDLDNDFVRCILLLGFVEDVDRPPRLVGNVRDVEPARLLLSNTLNLLKVFAGQFDLLEVFLDARGGDRLGDNRVSADLCPCEDDLGRGGFVLLSNLLDDVVLDKEWEAEHVVSEGLG